MSTGAAFDRLTELAAALFNVQTALITVVDEERVWFRSHCGYNGEGESRREESFCATLIGSPPGSVLVVDDAAKDKRFKTYRSVVEDGLRFYAGALITTADGVGNGAVCVIDTEPHAPPTEAQMQSLRLLAQMAGQEIDHARVMRRQAEHTAMLEMSEAMAGVGHWHYEMATGELRWSDEVFRIHGLEPQSVNPAAYLTGGRFHSDDAAAVWELIERAKKTGEGYDTRMRLMRDGEERVTRTRAEAELDASGRVVALFGVFQDVTESVKAEREQAELVETLKLAESLAGVGCWRLDVATGAVRWSDTVYKIHGVTPETFDPALDDAIAFYHPDDRPALRDGLTHAIETGECASIRLRIIRADGEERVVVSQYRPEIGEDGRTCALFGVFQDVTEETQALERIAASEARYRLLAKNSTDVIAIYGLDGVFRYLSPAIEQVLGYSAEELVGEAFSDFMHPEDVAGVQRAFADYARSAPGTPSPRVPYRGLHKDGTVVWLEAHPKLTRDEAGRPVEFQDVVRDITDTKRLEEELIAALDVAEAAAKSKSEFLANMSHELRTPLTSVIGFSGLLQTSEALPEAERRYADRIATSSEALLSVINDILDYSKLEAEAADLDPLAFDPGAMIRGAASIIEGQCETKGLTLAITTSPDLPEAIIGDEGRLRQVTLNFLSNAVKFTASGEIRLDVQTRGERLRVSVTDRGIGIAPEKIDTLFERFTQADASTTRVYGGTGLGLAISRRLIDMMGGDIGATSQLGQGSTFWFEVPLIAAKPLEIRAEDAVGGLPDGLRVLMADDAPANRELVRVLLEAWGVDLTTVQDGVEAVQAASVGDYDLILMDVHMPVMDGMNATRAIRGLGGKVASTPILALTANVQPAQIEVCRAAGMDDHVGKPIQVATLIEAMSRALRRPTATRERAVA